MSIEEWIASEFLLKSVEAKFAEGANVLSIKYKTRSPTQAALIANTFMSAFIDSAVEMKTTAAQQTARWFEPQMDKDPGRTERRAREIVEIPARE